MPRKGQVPRREVAADPKYNSVLVTRFVDAIMHCGKRSLAERAFYSAMAAVEQKAGQDAMTVLKQAMNNVKPVLEVKSRRVGGANYQVPVEVRPAAHRSDLRGEVRGRDPGRLAQRGWGRQEARGHAQDGGGQQGLRSLSLVVRQRDKAGLRRRPGP